MLGRLLILLILWQVGVFFHANLLSLSPHLVYEIFFYSFFFLFNAGILAIFLSIECCLYNLNKN